MCIATKSTKFDQRIIRKEHVHIYSDSTNSWNHVELMHCLNIVDFYIVDAQWCTYRPSIPPRTNSRRGWATFGTTDLRPTCLSWLLRTTWQSYPVVTKPFLWQVPKKALDRRQGKAQVGTDVGVVRIRLTINVGSTNQTLPKESFRACEEEKKKAALGPLWNCLQLNCWQKNGRFQQKWFLKKQSVQKGRYMAFI